MENIGTVLHAKKNQAKPTTIPQAVRNQITIKNTEKKIKNILINIVQTIIILKKNFRENGIKINTIQILDLE